MCSALFFSCTTAGWILATISFLIIFFLVLSLVFGKPREAVYAPETLEKNTLPEVSITKKEEVPKPEATGLRVIEDVNALIAKVQTPVEPTTAVHTKTSPFGWDKAATLIEKSLEKMIADRNTSIFCVSTGQLKIARGRGKTSEETVLEITSVKGVDIQILIGKEIRLPSSTIPSLKRGHPLEKWEDAVKEVENLLMRFGS